MTDSTSAQQAAVASAHKKATEATAAPLEAGRSDATAPTFSFDDGPLFGVDGNTTTTALPDDFFESPEWTDISPALTTSMSFNLDSCDTSPLLTDNYEAPDLSGIPLFGPFGQALYDSETPLKRSPQNAFSPVKETDRDSPFDLLRRALNSHSTAALESKDAMASDAVKRLLEPPSTASPAALSSPLPSTTRPTLCSSSSTESLHVHTSSSRGRKRRLGTADLIPVDAPVQPRVYKTISATSRKERNDFATEEEALAAERKRKSNTEAARKSRHEKAEKMRLMQESEEMWKRRCIRAEEERDQALARLAALGA